MRSGSAVRLALVGVGLVAVVAAASRIPGMLAGMSIFRVEGVRFEGTRFLAPEDALRSIVLPAGVSVWDDPDPWLGPLLEHPLVTSVEVERDLPDSLVLHVTETRPVALVPTPTLEPVDADGRRLPIDPSLHRLDLPLVRVSASDQGVDPGRVRTLVRELVRLGSAEGSFVDEVSELEWEGNGDAVALWGDDGLEIHFPIPLPAGRLLQAMSVLGDATTRFPDRRPRAVDLRYADQVVIRF